MLHDLNSRVSFPDRLTPYTPPYKSFNEETSISKPVHFLIHLALGR